MRRVLVVLSLLAAGCSVATGRTVPSPSVALATSDDAITVASFDFAESEILAELYAQAFEREGIRVVRQLRLGPREFVQPALQQGLVEFVPEYAGSLLGFLTRSAHPASADLREVRDALEHELAGRGLVEFASAPAEDRNAFATTFVFAAANDVTSLSDLAGLPAVVLGGPPECEVRPLCAAGLEDTYGLRFERFVALDLSGPLTRDALVRGVIDVGLVLTTSPILQDDALVVLVDDRGLQPAEHVTPIVHASVVERFGPAVEQVANRVSAALTTDGLRELNAEVETGVTPSDAAAAWLDRHGFPPTGPG